MWGIGVAVLAALASTASASSAATFEELYLPSYDPYPVVEEPRLFGTLNFTNIFGNGTDATGLLSAVGALTIIALAVVGVVLLICLLIPDDEGGYGGGGGWSGGGGGYSSSGGAGYSGYR